MNSRIKVERNTGTVFTDAINSLLVQLYTDKKKSGNKLILLTGCNAQCGTSTISMNLAIELAAMGCKTLIVDCDMRKNTVTGDHLEKASYGLKDYLSGEIEVDKIINKTNFPELDYISSGEYVSNPIKYLSCANLEKMINNFSDKYDFILFDTPSINTVSDAIILFPYVDTVLLVIELEKTLETEFIDAKEKICRNTNCYSGIIVNKVNKKEYKAFSKDYDYYKSKIRLNHNKKKAYKSRKNRQSASMIAAQKND